MGLLTILRQFGRHIISIIGSVYAGMHSSSVSAFVFFLFIFKSNLRNEGGYLGEVFIVLADEVCCNRPPEGHCSLILPT